MTAWLSHSTTGGLIVAAMGEGGLRRRFLLLYGSQTGQAEVIAERVRDLALERGLAPDMHCISQSEKKVRG